MSPPAHQQQSHHHQQQQQDNSNDGNNQHNRNPEDYHNKQIKASNKRHSKTSGHTPATRIGSPTPTSASSSRGGGGSGATSGSKKATSGATSDLAQTAAITTTTNGTYNTKHPISKMFAHASSGSALQSSTTLASSSSPAFSGSSVSSSALSISPSSSVMSNKSQKSRTSTHHKPSTRAAAAATKTKTTTTTTITDDQTASTSTGATNATSSDQEQLEAEYRLLLSPMFSAMTRITDHLFLTGVGGMTRENFRKNHIDFVVNITTEAPFWQGLESMRLPLEDDLAANILPYFDIAIDKIQEQITKNQAHVLVHCVAGVSRSAAVVIAYLMKTCRMDLHGAFNHCYNLRPVIRPNNSFMLQLINYERQLFGKNSVRMVEADVDGTLVSVPNFFINEHPKLVLLEVFRVREQLKNQTQALARKQAQLDN